MAEISARVQAITRSPEYASQLTAMITELSLTDIEAKSLFETIDSAALDRATDYIKKIEEVSKYEGFNPREMASMLLKMHTTHHAEVLTGGDAEEISAEITVGGASKSFNFTSDMPFGSDIQFICLMFITRGSAFDKIMSKSSEAMKKCMTLLKTKYNINTTKKRPGTTLDSKVVTIPRIAATFPGVTVGLFHRGIGRTIYDVELLFPGITPPRALFSPMISSVLVHKENAPLAVMLALAVKVDDVLHQVDNKTPLTSLYTYMLASYNSTATTNLMKMKYCDEWRLGVKTNGEFEYNDVVVNMRPRAVEIIRSSRNNDPSLNSILSKV